MADDITQKHLDSIERIEKLLAEQVEANNRLHSRLIESEHQKNLAQKKLLMYIAFAGTVSLCLNLFKPKIKIVRYADVKDRLR